MHWGSRPSREGTRLVLTGGTVSPMMCPADGQHNDNKKRAGGRPGKERGETRSQNKSRPATWWSVVVDVVFAWCFGVIRCDTSWCIAIDGCIISHIIFGITSYDTSRCRIHIPNFWDWYEDIASRRNISRYRRLWATPNCTNRGWG